MQRSPIDMSAATSLSSRDVSTDRREAASVSTEKIFVVLCRSADTGALGARGAAFPQPPADLLVDLNLDPFDTTEGE